LDDIKNIFSEIEVIYGLNQFLLKELEGKMEKWHPNAMVGGIFIRMTKVLNWYTQYVNNYNNAFSTLTRLKTTNPEFSQFLSKTENLPQCKFTDLASFLIMPVQRIPRYNLLLADLTKNTWEDHPDYADLTSATKLMVEIATHVNKKKKEADNIKQVMAIQQNLVGNKSIALPHRRLKKRRPNF